jgi:hypothetical protein
MWHEKMQIGTTPETHWLNSTMFREIQWLLWRRISLITDWNDWWWNNATTQPQNERSLSSRFEEFLQSMTINANNNCAIERAMGVRDIVETKYKIQDQEIREKAIRFWEAIVAFMQEKCFIKPMNEFI